MLENKIIDSILEKKGREIIVLDLEKTGHAFCDKFIVCHAESTTQVSAIADSIERKVKEDIHIKAHHREGSENSIWVLLDFSDILVHIFQKEYREYYKLEELWGDAETKQIEESFNF